jgi:uncharacterized protein (DUF2336 family)
MIVYDFLCAVRYSLCCKGTESLPSFAKPEMTTNNSLIAELEEAISGGSQPRRVETLRRITDLFLHGADRLNDAQIGVFDDVLMHLIERIEEKALAQLSARLAPVDNAPGEVIRRLARSDEITVAGPVLTQSTRLTTIDLVEIAKTKGQAHLLAISGRAHIEEAVTDQLLNRGDREVAHKLAKNAGAQFSQSGFATLVSKAERDETLAKSMGVRLDLPFAVLEALLSKATEAVRSWLLSHAPSEAKAQIQGTVAAASATIAKEISAPRDFTRAEQVIAGMQKNDELNEATILRFANAHSYEEMVVGLSALCSGSVPLIAALMKSERNEGLLVACKAAELKWPTASAVLRHRLAHRPLSDEELAAAKTDYLTLSQASAQRTLRFWQIRAAT